MAPGRLESNLPAYPPITNTTYGTPRWRQLTTCKHHSVDVSLLRNSTHPHCYKLKSRSFLKITVKARVKIISWYNDLKPFNCASETRSPSPQFSKICSGIKGTIKFSPQFSADPLLSFVNNHRHRGQHDDLTIDKNRRLYKHQHQIIEQLVTDSV